MALSLVPVFPVQAEDKPVFSKVTVDLGIVVSDLNKAAEFYTEVIGLTEVKGFSVSGERTAEFGLADNQPITVRRFVLNDGARLSKIMPLRCPGRRPIKNSFTPRGFSYLTIFVNDMDAAVERRRLA